MGVAGGGDDVEATEPRGVNEAVEGSLRWRECSVLPASGAEMKSTVN
jgi:hypothetical protein